MSFDAPELIEPAVRLLGSLALAPAAPGLVLLALPIFAFFNTKPPAPVLLDGLLGGTARAAGAVALQAARCRRLPGHVARRTSGRLAALRTGRWLAARWRGRLAARWGRRLTARRGRRRRGLCRQRATQCDAATQRGRPLPMMGVLHDVSASPSRVIRVALVPHAISMVLHCKLGASLATEEPASDWRAPCSVGPCRPFVKHRRSQTGCACGQAGTTGRQRWQHQHRKTRRT